MQLGMALIGRRGPQREIADLDLVAASAEAIVPDAYGTDAFCQRCELSSHPSWPLTPRARVFEVLGWSREPNSRLKRTGAGEIIGRRRESAAPTPREPAARGAET